MAKGALFIGWGQTVRGREQKALQVFNESVQYWASLEQNGAIERFETYLLEVHGGDLAGFALLHGDREKLDRLRSDAEFVRHTNRANLIVDNLGIVAAFTGEELTTMLSVYEQEISELT
jgi:hypothetical protein